jgi:hypothetical protein
VNPLLSGSQIRGIIESTAQDQIGDPAEDVLGWDPYHGHGLINALEAVLAATETTTQAFTISNHGCSEVLTITAIDKEYGAPWLSVEPASPMDIGPGAEKQIVVRIDPSGLVAGSYTDRLLIYSNDVEKSPYPDGVYIHLTVTCDLPLIIEEPSDLVVDEGQDATFSITAASDEPLSYVWTVNGVIVGDDSPNLIIEDVTEEENGAAIACEVVNSCGSLFSRTAILTVIDTCPPDFDDDGDVDGLDLVVQGSMLGDMELFDFAAEFGGFECLAD